MSDLFRKTFFPTEEEKEEHKKLIESLTEQLLEQRKELEFEQVKDSNIYQSVPFCGFIGDCTGCSCYHALPAFSMGGHCDKNNSPCGHGFTCDENDGKYSFRIKEGIMVEEEKDEKMFNNIIINNKKIQCSGSNISIINGEVIVDGKKIGDPTESKSVNITIDGNVRSLRCNNGNVNVKGDAWSVDCGGSCNVTGDVKKCLDCGGSCSVAGNVSGSIDCGGSCVCNNVDGDIDAGGNVTVKGVVK